MNLDGENCGIIPAYAGSTGFRRRPPPEAPDHPRIRGEHCIADKQLARPFGSSPHTRGAPHSALSPLLDDGIIPAYAGSTQVTP